MTGIGNSLLVAAMFALFAPIRAVPVDEPNDPQSPIFQPMSEPDPSNGPPEYPPSVSRKFKGYVALGDSYSAGPGATRNRIATAPGPSQPYSTDCFQTDGGWPVQLKNALDSNLDFQFSACTGWDTKAIRQNEVLDPNSNFNGPNNDWPDLVTLTMGGNNNNSFADVVMACSYGLTFETCEQALDAAQATIDSIDQEFTDTMNAIMDQGRDGWRTLVVMGYPALYNQDTTGIANCKPTTTQRARINTLVTNVNNVLQRIASTTNTTYSKKPASEGGGDVVFADPNAAWKSVTGVDVPGDRKFDQHRFCEQYMNQSAFLNGGSVNLPSSLDPTTWWHDYKTGLFHPDANGMRVMSDAALIALSRLSANVPTGAGTGGNVTTGSSSGAGNGSTTTPASSISCSATTLDDTDQGPVTGTEAHESRVGDQFRRSLSRFSPRGLENRGLDSSSMLTFQPAGGAKFSFAPPDYPNAGKVGQDKGWYSSKYPNQCGLGMVDMNLQETTPPTGFTWVTEHVFEKQCLRNYIQFMTQGKLPSGGPLRQGAANVPGIFDQTGIFFSNWPAGNTWPAWGATPKDTAFGVLGHKTPGPSDMANLMVLDSVTNSMKALISKGWEFVSDATWDRLDKDPNKISERSWIIQKGALVNAYMQQDGVVKAYNHAYVHIRKFWRVFATLPGAQAGYDYEGAFAAIVADDLQLQVSTHAKNWNYRVHQVKDDIGPDPAGDSDNFVFGAVMSNFLDDQDKLISYNIAGMTASNSGDDQGDPTAIDPGSPGSMEIDP